MDVYIQQLQTKIHDSLIVSWGLSDATKYEAYGRCDRNKTDDGYMAQIYKGGNEYGYAYWNDTLTAISFFGISNNIKRNLKSEADVHFVMFADLSKVALKDKQNNLIAHRADEELRQSVTEIIGRYSNGFTLVSTDLWLENVLKEYPGSIRDQQLKFVDRHPVHSFRINLKLIYDSNKNCLTPSIK